MAVSPGLPTTALARIILVALVLIVSLVVTACRVAPSASGGGTKATTPRVYFTEPANGATVSSPVALKWAADGIKVEPAADGVKPGSGHLHVMINTPCVANGQVIPTDDNHRHFGMAQMGATIELPPGAYKLCLQMADGAHVALPGAGMRQEISITVR